MRRSRFVWYNPSGMKSLIIIKLGGSVITYKNSLVPKPRKDNIRSLALEISDLYKTGKYRIVLVHGAGSFGHPIVKKYGLHLGAKTLGQKVALGQTNQNMLDLNKLVVGSLLKEGIPVVPLSPHAMAAQSAGQLTIFDHQIIKDYIAHDFVPVLFGDAVLDDKMGCSILSGDTIVSYLAKKLSAKKVVFLSDVDGVFDKDPVKNSRAKLIRRIDGTNIKSVLRVLASVNHTSRNVTGEMYGKITAINNNLKKIKVVIANGLEQGGLTKALKKNSISTRLYFN